MDIRHDEAFLLDAVNQHLHFRTGRAWTILEVTVLARCERGLVEQITYSPPCEDDPPEPARSPRSALASRVAAFLRQQAPKGYKGAALARNLAVKYNAHFRKLLAALARDTKSGVRHDSQNGYRYRRTDEP